jgi:hypothetical protein
MRGGARAARGAIVPGRLSPAGYQKARTWFSVRRRTAARRPDRRPEVETHARGLLESPGSGRFPHPPRIGTLYCCSGSLARSCYGSRRGRSWYCCSTNPRELRRRSAPTRISPPNNFRRNPHVSPNAAWPSHAESLLRTSKVQFRAMEPLANCAQPPPHPHHIPARQPGTAWE